MAASPSVNHDDKLPVVPQLQRDPRVLPLRVAAMFKVLVCSGRAYFSFAYQS